MRKSNLLLTALIFAMATCSQTAGIRDPSNISTAGRTQDAFEIRQSVYFEDGSLDEFTTSRWDTSYTHVDYQGRFSASGALLEQIEYSYSEEIGNILTRLTRDVEERLRNRIVYQYNPQGLLWRESLVDNRGRVVSTYEFGYDNRGNRTSRTIKNRAGDELAVTTFTFDNANRLTRSETRDMGGSVISSTTFSYDGQGNLVAQQVANAAGSVTSNIRAVWQEGREIRNETTGADGTMHMRITNEYGPQGQLLIRTIENFQGQSTQVMRYEYDLRPRRRS